MIGDVVIAEPKDQSRPPEQYVVVREWSNAVELVTGRPGIMSYRPFRVELDGSRRWVILGRGRSNELIQHLLKWLKLDSKSAVIEWTVEAKFAFESTAELLEGCLRVTNLIGAKIVAEQPYGPGKDEFVVLKHVEGGLWVVPTNIGAYGHSRFLQTSGRGAWHITQTTAGIADLKALIVTLAQISGTDNERRELTDHLARMLGQ